MSDSDTPPDVWASIVIAKTAGAIDSLDLTADEKAWVRAWVASAVPGMWPWPYAPEFTGPRTACGCPDRPDEDYQEHPDEPCDWSHWHPNKHSPGLREDRFCWKCGAMETQEIR
jgi:hypothetical protein